MGKIIKFILKLAITAGIIVGVIFGVSYLITPKGNAAKIVNSDKEYGIVQKIEFSYNGGVEKTGKNGETEVVTKGIIEMLPDAPSAAYQYTANTKSTILPANKKVNDILSVYYNYYLATSFYVSAEDSNLQNEVLSAMSEFNTQVDKTIKYLKAVDARAAVFGYASLNYSNDIEFFARVEKWAKSYQKQTNLLIKLDDVLRKYVCKTNYQTDVTEYSYVGEVKLEVVKEYAKAVYKDAVYQNVKGETISEMLKDNSSTSFNKTYSKFMSAVGTSYSPSFSKLFKDNTTSNYNENVLYLYYGSLENKILYNTNFDLDAVEPTQDNLTAGFFQLSETYQEKYRRSSYMANDKEQEFIEYYYGEDIEEGAAYYKAQMQYMIASALYNYLSNSSL